MRIEKIKIIRKKLQKNQVSIGTWQQIPHASISEILGHAGYDWVAADMEHGSVSVEQLPDLFRAIELGGTLPLARIAESKSKDCKQALDAGAGGVIAPMIESADQLETIRDACRWPPAGSRGVGFSRSNLFGKHFDEYKAEAQLPLLIAQIEHINAVNNLAEILQVKGLDAIIVGPYDLSASMGLTAEFDNKKFISVINRIITLCKKYNIPCGDHIVHPDPDLLATRIEQGFRFIAYGTDGVFFYTSSISPRL
jgi:2-dehydro-3-deoxyglucarate aldolase|tara:strand:- start:1565 stop:2323 length:759 start_codon:yes stop_codon:yes gene_type:complete